MIGEGIFNTILATIKEANKENIGSISKKSLEVITPLCEKFGYDQGQILQIRKAVEDAGGDGAITQELLEKTKTDNIVFI